MGKLAKCQLIPFYGTRTSSASLTKLGVAWAQNIYYDVIINDVMTRLPGHVQNIKHARSELLTVVTACDYGRKVYDGCRLDKIIKSAGFEFITDEQYEKEKHAS